MSAVDQELFYRYFSYVIVSLGNAANELVKQWIFNISDSVFIGEGGKEKISSEIPSVAFFLLSHEDMA